MPNWDVMITYVSDNSYVESIRHYIVIGDDALTAPQAMILASKDFVDGPWRNDKITKIDVNRHEGLVIDAR